MSATPTIRATAEFSLNFKGKAYAPEIRAVSDAPMNDAMNIAASGMRTAFTQFTKAASNLVAAQTAGATTASAPASANSAAIATTMPGGLTASLATAVSSDPIAPVVNMLEARTSFMANLAVFKAADKTDKSTLDLIC
jgi:flagellar basal body rod protein FlgC